MNKYKTYMYIGIFILLLSIVGSATTYAWLTWKSTSNTSLTMTIGRMADVTFISGNDISTSTLAPVFNYTDGEKTTFSINNRDNTGTPVKYIVKLNITSIADELKSTSLKYKLLKGDEELADGNFSEASSNTTLNIYTDSLSVGTTDLAFYLYIDGNDDNDLNMMNKSITGAIEVTTSVEETPEHCFYSSYNDSDMTASINSYNCNEDNEFGYEPVTDTVVTPSYVSGINISIKENPTDQARKNCALILPALASSDGLSITTDNATTLCNGGTVNGITFEILCNQYQDQIKGNAPFVYSGMFDITIDESKKYKVITIHNYALDVPWMNYIDVSNIIISNTVTSIGSSSFYGSRLESITIPESVTSIGGNAIVSYSRFNPNLKIIYNKTGRVFDWKSIVNGTNFTTTDGGITGEVITNNNYGKVIISK